jgi:hypothetical protein
VTSNIRGYGGVQQKKCNAKPDDEWDLPHDMAPPCVFALSRAAAGIVRGGIVGVTARKSVGLRRRALFVHRS